VGLHGCRVRGFLVGFEGVSGFANAELFAFS
jgi:hypothetical protein